MTPVDTAEQQTMEISYDLFALPSAQHKAGLAGLLILIRSLSGRLSPGEGLLPEISSLSESGATIVFTRESLQTLFDDLYDAVPVEIASQTKFQGQEPKETTERLIGGKMKKVFLYEVLRPKGAFFASWFREGRNSPWLRLWRDMLWATLRAIPTTRGVYEERSEHRPSSVPAGVWSALQKNVSRRKKGRLTAAVADGISGSIAIGVQDVNAEKVGFQGTIEQNLLLHFWQLAALTFVPRRTDYNGDTTYAGFVLAIPEVASLESFVDEWIAILGNDQALSPVVERGRPKQAIVDLPAEGGFEYLYQLSRNLVSRRLGIDDLLSGVELYHLEKQGNNVRLLTAERVAASQRLIGEYDAIRGSIRNPYFKVLRLTNLLRNQPWFADAGRLFARERSEIFVRGDRTPRQIGFFGSDAFMQFQKIIGNLRIQESVREGRMAAEKDDLLARRIYNLIRDYVRHRVEKRTGMKSKDVAPGKPPLSPEQVQKQKAWLDEVERVCSDAFLAIRGRTEDDFVEYFAGTIFAVPQFLLEDDFVSLSEALQKQSNTVKTLALMAISAQSSIINKVVKQEESPVEDAQS